MTTLDRLSILAALAFAAYVYLWPLLHRRRPEPIAPRTEAFLSCTEQLITVEREQYQRDENDETDAVPEGLGLSRCPVERVVPVDSLDDSALRALLDIAIESGRWHA